MGGRLRDTHPDQRDRGRDPYTPPAVACVGPGRRHLQPPPNGLDAPLARARREDPRQPRARRAAVCRAPALTSWCATGNRAPRARQDASPRRDQEEGRKAEPINGPTTHQPATAGRPRVHGHAAIRAHADGAHRCGSRGERVLGADRQAGAAACHCIEPRGSRRVAGVSARRRVGTVLVRIPEQGHGPSLHEGHSRASPAPVRSAAFFRDGLA